jgi:hypothetical protein
MEVRESTRGNGETMVSSFFAKEIPESRGLSNRERKQPKKRIEKLKQKVDQIEEREFLRPDGDRGFNLLCRRSDTRFLHPIISLESKHFESDNSERPDHSPKIFIAQ